LLDHVFGRQGKEFNFVTGWRPDLDRNSLISLTGWDADWIRLLARLSLASGLCRQHSNREKRMPIRGACADFNVGPIIAFYLRGRYQLFTPLIKRGFRQAFATAKVANTQATSRML
jgi:hypothetical protein